MSKHSEQSPMKLSEAIRLGSMLGAQKFGTLGDIDSGADGTCALGAAIAATGGRLVERISDGTRAVSNGRFTYKVPAGEICSVYEAALAWESMLSRDMPCELCPGPPMQVALLIAHLNDAHEWTREAIADWVEQIEQAQSSALVPRSAENIMEKEGAMVNK